MQNDPRQAQMEEIWRLTTTTDVGQQRLAMSSEPWLIESARREDGTELRVKFEDGRKKEEIPLWERRQRFIQARRYLFAQAESARMKASSWRKFYVGTALLAFREGYKHEDSWRVFTGMNMKQAENMRTVCSEPIALAAAILEGYDLVIGQTVVGEKLAEQAGTTLHPCRNCRWCMHEFMNDERPKLRIIDKHTIVHTAFPMQSENAGISETQSVEELFAFHREKSGDDFA